MENLNTRGFWNEFCLSTLCGIAVVGAVGSNTTNVIFNCYLGVAIPLVSSPQSNKIIGLTVCVISYAGQGFPSFITALLLLIFAQYTSPLFPVHD